MYKPESESRVAAMPTESYRTDIRYLSISAVFCGYFSDAKSHFVPPNMAEDGRFVNANEGHWLSK
jgi:hypothetical protein